MSEPVITINGVELSAEQAMVVRVLLDRFESDLQSDKMALAANTSKTLAPFLATTRSILALMRLS